MRCYPQPLRPREHATPPHGGAPKSAARRSVLALSSERGEEPASSFSCKQTRCARLTGTETWSGRSWSVHTLCRLKGGALIGAVGQPHRVENAHPGIRQRAHGDRSEEHTSELQSHSFI